MYSLSMFYIEKKELKEKSNYSETNMRYKKIRIVGVGILFEFFFSYT